MIDLLKSYIGKKKSYIGTSLEVQRLRLHLPMQGCVGSIPGQGIKIPHASWPKNQSIKQKQDCYKFNKDFKNNPHQKKIEKKKKAAYIEVIQLDEFGGKYIPEKLHHNLCPIITITSKIFLFIIIL